MAEAVTILSVLLLTYEEINTSPESKSVIRCMTCAHCV